MADGQDTDRHPDILDDVPMKAPDEAPRWLDDERNVRKIVSAVYAICGVLLVIDPFVHKHGYFEIEHVWGIYGVFGLVGCGFLVLAAKEMRRIIMMPEDYWDRIEGPAPRPEGQDDH